LEKKMMYLGITSGTSAASSVTVRSVRAHSRPTSGRVVGLGSECIADVGIEVRVAELRDISVDLRVRDEVLAAKVDIDEL
jgi:hypothetical protein